MKKIGILTLPFGPNYGMNLQLYALQEILRQMDCNVVVINRKWNRIRRNSGVIAAIKRYFYYKFVCNRIFRFYQNNINLSRPCYTSEEIANVCKDYDLDVVVIGSDQVWRIENTRGANLDFFGGFSDYLKNVKLFSYAASFGNDKWKGTTDETKAISVLLKKFGAISVREETAILMCSELFDVDSVCTLDPTLLLPAIDYPIAPKYGFTNSIIVSYILDKSETKRKIVDNIRKHKHIEKHFELYPPNRKSYTRYKYSVEEWLYYISNASFIVTDSYHGMLFSIIFKRQFLVLGNDKTVNKTYKNVFGFFLNFGLAVEKAKTTKKVVLRLECSECKKKSLYKIKRCKTFVLGGTGKVKSEY